MAKIKVVRFPETANLCEIYQDVEMKFSFVAGPQEGYKQCHQLAKCRDFLHDAVFAHLNKGSVSIFSFVYKHGTNPPIDTNKMRMLVRKAGKDSAATFKNQMDRAVELINHYENMAGWTKSKVLEVEKEADFRMFVGAGEWMKAPHLVSMYTFLMRLGARKVKFKTDDDLRKEYKRLTVKESGNDVGYLRHCFEKMHLVVSKSDKLVKKNIGDNYPKGTNTSSLHNCGGIVSLCRGIHFMKPLNDEFKKVCAGK